MSRRVYIETYGCQMNLADSELALGLLAEHGFEEVASPAEADVILVNTCAIREHAEERVVGRLMQLRPHKLRSAEVKIGVLGCMAQHHRARLLDRLPFLDLVLGPDEYRRLPAVLDAEGYDDPMIEVRLGREETYADVAPARRDRVRAWVSVMRGCDKFCSFCVVPYVRGRERSLALPDLLQQMRVAAEQGFREVVFLGQTVNAYRDGEHDFADLLHAASRIDGIERIRFTSPHPSDMSERIVEAMAREAKICPQLHLPLQSASDAVLERMERGYTIEEYDRLVTRLRAVMPGIALSTDIIVGFPGETEADFQATIDYLGAAGFDHAFLFAYSAREGTKAARWPETVTAEEKNRRLRTIIELQERISAEKNRVWTGRTVEVLVEGKARRGEGWMVGKSAEFKTTVFASARHGVG
ncbi:MAG: tRNA (N6-isopentenyl adenosine(37)-C2)-methylthiotransferase MiaB, partial [Candidatus Binatia bacterium]